VSQIPVLSGIYTDAAADLRSSLPRNYVPVPKDSGISQGYLRPADGISLLCALPGIDRGGINWQGTLYRVAGTKLVSISPTGVVTVLGDVGGTGQVSLDYSFDRLSIGSGGKLFYWDGATLAQVTDPDLGTVVDQMWIDSYTMTTDGANLVVTDLNDPFAVNPVKYGSSEVDPDRVVGLRKLRDEAYALNRYTIEVYNNIGGDFFPFQRVDSAMVPRGCIGTHASCLYAGTIAFLGSGRNEAPSVYLVAPGDTVKIATREVEQILENYSEAQLAQCLVEARNSKAHQHLLIHLPDQTLVYDAAASTALEQPVWFILTSSVDGNGIYRARNFVWCYDRWIVGDPAAARAGIMTNAIATHYDETVGWEFGTMVLYAEGNGAIIHEMELVCLPGRVALGDDPVVWTSYSQDGDKWSQERPKSCGKQGETQKRLAWRQMGKLLNWRVQKFRGTSDSLLSVVRLEMKIEPLFTRPGRG
jgi:hypothetical protein